MLRKFAFALSAASLAFSATPVAADQTVTAEIERADTQALIPHGWREALFSVTDLEEVSDFFSGSLGWEVRASGAVDPRQLSAWGLPSDASARYILMANPGSERGFVRFIDFDGVPQRRIREHDQPWETGGIFNINIRVANMDAIARQVTEAGWIAPSAPVQFTFGPFVVKEWIPRSPDGFRVAFIERVAPPLEGWPNLVTTSRSFNSTQIVSDMNAAREFYVGILGFDTFLQSRRPSPEPGESVIGLSREATASITRDVWIVNPTDYPNEGSIELLEFEGYSGRKFDEFAVPPNLGNLALRFPVPDLDALLAYLASRDVAPVYEPTTRHLAPYGKVRITAIRSPEGAMLEFFEELED